MVYLEYLGWNNSGGHPWQNNGAEYIGGSPGRRNRSAEVIIHYLLSYVPEQPTYSMNLKSLIHEALN